MKVGTRVSWEAWNVNVNSITVQTGTVAKVYAKGTDPLVKISPDDVTALTYPTRPFTLRLSKLTTI